MKNRLFISLDITNNVIDQIIRLRKVVCNDEKLNWEPKERIHLTIKFIGDVSNEVMEKISNEIIFIEDYSQIKCSINNFGFFFRDEKPFILWAGLTVEDFINKIISEIDRRLVKFNIQVEPRKFKPHMTLLRIKKPIENSFVNSFKNFKFEQIFFNADSISLYKSVLHPQGPEYIKIKNYKLKELEK